VEVCDVAEFCTGSGAACPVDAKSTGVCRSSAGVCDVAESCDGVNTGCPANGFVANGTPCDDGNVGTINDQCQSGVCAGVAPVCGNGKMEGGEQCDDGNTSNTDACLNTCVTAICGDGFVRAGVEQCDDGNTVSSDGCSATCTIEGAQEICNNCVDDDGDGQIDLRDADCPSSALTLHKGMLNLGKPVLGDEKVSLQGTLTVAPGMINPPVDGAMLSFIDGDGKIACFTFPPGSGWTTKAGPQWTFNKNELSLKFDAKKGTFALTVKIKEAELSDPDAGVHRQRRTSRLVD